MGRVLAVVGALLTWGYLVFAWWLVGDRVQTLQTLALNEVGDFFAGAFGPLAILWLVLGFFQQGLELRQNNEALRLQAEELKNSVEQQKEMVAVTREQVSAELEQLRVERERRAAALEPVFAFRDIGGFQNNGQGEYAFHGAVTNAGSKITELTASIDNEMYRFTEVYLSSLLHGATFNFALYLGDLDDHSEVSITFNYRNDDGAYRSQSFVMVPIPPETNRVPLLRRI
ncbi:hypothetical protein CR512_14445 [Pseudomonas putida]|nr:hypothetical protein CR512_14445 [Pseudomonas putida]